MGNKRVHGLEDKDTCNLTPSPLEWSFLDVSSQDKNFLKKLGAVFSHGLDILTPKLPKISPDIAISADNTTLYMISNVKTPSKKIGALIRFMQFLSSGVALYLYNYIIRPCMEYCCHIWAGAPSCCLEC